MTDVVVTLKHIRTVPGFNGRQGYCVSGLRAWLEANGFDYRDFLKNGLSVETLEATGDPFALRAAAHAREEASRG